MAEERMSRSTSISPPHIAARNPAILTSPKRHRGVIHTAMLTTTLEAIVCANAR